MTAWSRTGRAPPATRSERSTPMPSPLADSRNGRLSRRTFVVRVGLLAAGAAAVPLLEACASPAPSSAPPVATTAPAPARATPAPAATSAAAAGAPTAAAPPAAAQPGAAVVVGGGRLPTYVPDSGG